MPFPGFLIENFHEKFFIFGWEKWITISLLYLIGLCLIFIVIIVPISFYEKYKKIGDKLTMRGISIFGICLGILFLFTFFIVNVNSFGWFRGISIYVGFLLFIFSILNFLYYSIKKTTKTFSQKEKNIRAISWLSLSLAILIFLMFLLSEIDIKSKEQANVHHKHLTSYKWRNFNDT